MLTATYSFVALTAEQDMARSVLQRLRQGVQNIWSGIQKVDFPFLREAFDKLFQFDHFCRHRKLDLYVIPVLRRVTHEADTLLEQLDSLRESSLAVLSTAKERLVATYDHAGTLHMHEAVHAMELFLENMRTRLKREEDELFPMLRRLLSVEDWFAVAALFLEEDGVGCGKGRHNRAAARRQAVSALGSLSLH